MNLETAFRAYVDCALWASIDDEGEPLDALYNSDDIADEALDDMRADVEDFIQLLDREQITYPLTDEQFGYDFWLTRNRHGAGFWDRGIGDVGDELTKYAQAYGESDLYVGDDGYVYVTPCEVARTPKGRR